MTRMTLVGMIAAGLGIASAAGAVTPRAPAVAPFVAVHLAGLPMPVANRWPEPATVTVPPASVRGGDRGMGAYGWKSCGFGVVRPAFAEEEAAARPDPVAWLATSYRSCARIRVTVVEGYGPAAENELGRWLVNTAIAAGERDRMWADVTEERQVGRYFRASCAVMAEPETSWWWYGPDPLTAPEYRQETNFRTELILEFVGGKGMVMEINFTSGRFILQTSDAWAAYVLDAARVDALLGLLAEEAGPGSEPDLEKL